LPFYFLLVWLSFNVIIILEKKNFTAEAQRKRRKRDAEMGRRGDAETW
jgi:hypothetical protein